MFDILLGVLWFIWPAYVANAFPPVIRGKKPIDFGKTWRKKHIFGKNKTIEGALGGVIFGTAVGLFQALSLQPLIVPYLQIPILTPLTVIKLSVGAILGDLLGSFIKRRKSIKSGEPLPIVDQLDFIFGALLLTGFPLPFTQTLLLLFITLIFHVISNIFAYLTKVKRHIFIL